MSFYTVKLEKNFISLLDQRKLPLREIYLNLENYEQVAKAIENMSVRGAPAIGVTAALGIALGAMKSKALTKKDFEEDFYKISNRFANTRPTALNLFWAIEKMKECYEANKAQSISKTKRLLTKEAKKIAKEDKNINRKLGSYGAGLIEDGDVILTHCNAGALATAGFGTALGVIRSAVAQGKKIKVLADETRPLLQGARLTTWELKKDKIDVTLISDNMAGYLMAQKRINKIVVGADRIAANGDTANKIGTYTVAVLANVHKIPFYVAAPTSTIDGSLKSGDAIPIEERKPFEVEEVFGTRIAPVGIKVVNPAFDVTPARLISAIITEKGQLVPPYSKSIKKALDV